MIDNVVNFCIIKSRDRAATRQTGTLPVSRATIGTTKGRLIMHRRQYPTQEKIKSALDYNSETGIFVWRHRPEKDIQWNAKHAGKVAGTTTERYVIISIDEKSFQAHRLAWIYVYGNAPFGDLDHKNTRKKDNWIDNLRLATRPQNLHNYLLSKHNSSGVRGVTWNRQNFRWEAHIKHNDVHYHLGSFMDFNDAVKARYNAEVAYGFTKYLPESTAYQYLQEA
jgi:hypothetical protein